MTFNEGDKVRYKDFPWTSGYADWNGVEGTVIGSDKYSTRVSITKSAVSTKNKYTKVGDELSLTTGNLELVPVDRKVSVGDKIRIKKTVDIAEKWVGVEGVAVALPTHGDYYQIRLTTTAPGIYYGVGEIISLPGRKFDVMKTAAEIAEEEKAAAAPRIGSKVRVTSGVWEGTVGEVIEFSGSRAYIKVFEPSKGCWLDVGEKGSTSIERLEVVPETKTEEELPRVVERDEIRVGDTIRVTYAKKVQTFGDVVETGLGTVREGVVATVNSAGRFDSEQGYRIDPMRDGEETVYELLAREPEAPEVPVNPMTEAAVGAQFRTSHGPVGKRLLTKIAEDKWSDLFMATGDIYSTGDRNALTTFNLRGGEWVSV